MSDHGSLVNYPALKVSMRQAVTHSLEPFIFCPQSIYSSSTQPSRRVVCLYVLIYPKSSQTVINIMSLIPLPKFIDLPLKPTDPPNSAWGLWSKNGFDDQLGSLNYLTDDLVLRTMREEIRTGKRMGLK
jgi:hypothetical protein